MSKYIDYLGIHNIYYEDLTTALIDLGISKAGVDEIKSKQPLSSADDRIALRSIVVMIIKLEQEARPVQRDKIDLTWLYVYQRLALFGLRELSRHELYDGKPMTNADDRAALLSALSRALVRNDNFTPRRMPEHMKRIWKRAQLEKQR